MDVLEELVRLRRSGERCALATIVEVNGSIPSFESAKDAGARRWNDPRHHRRRLR
jgi:xanthine/CO dehydrogenase XdhC/CoxF family maturation factor